MEYRPKNPIIYKPIVASLGTQGTSPVREQINNIDLNPVAREKNVRDDAVIWSGPFFTR